MRDFPARRGSALTPVAESLVCPSWYAFVRPPVWCATSLTIRDFVDRFAATQKEGQFTQSKLRTYERNKR
jgi:hypothetical protein